MNELGIWAGWVERARNVALAAALALSAGCATVNGGNGEVNDPLEPINRAVFAFNDGFDAAIFKPIATAYVEIMPDPVRDWVRNFFANIEDLIIGLNNLLQGKPLDAATDWMRFAVNTIVGFGGINDFATAMGLEKHDEDFGQTLGRWGMDYGAYVVWPFTGPSTIRESIGGLVYYAVDPVWQHRPIRERNTLYAIRAVSKRADLLVASDIMEQAALDKYIFTRDAYLARRRDLIYDGRPPRNGAETSGGQLPVTQQQPADAATRLLEEPAAGSDAQARDGDARQRQARTNHEAVLAAASPGE